MHAPIEGASPLPRLLELRILRAQPAPRVRECDRRSAVQAYACPAKLAVAHSPKLNRPDAVSMPRLVTAPRQARARKEFPTSWTKAPNRGHLSDAGAAKLYPDARRPASLLPETCRRSSREKEMPAAPGLRKPVASWVRIARCSEPIQTTSRGEVQPCLATAIVGDRHRVLDLPSLR